MSDLIDRQKAIDALIDALAWTWSGTWSEKAAIDAIKNLPSAEREREKGKWVFSRDHAEGICTMCNFKIHGRPYNNTYLIVPYNYCPNCGAKMDGERIDDAKK